MWTKLHLARVSWTLIDQGVVSVGTFLVNITLARHLPQSDYGSFALLFGGIFTLQFFLNALLFHPLQVRVVVAREDERARLLTASLILLAIPLTGLSALLAAVLVAIGGAELVLPAAGCLLLGQLQEATRRGLHTNFRYRAAVLGDSISCLGKAAAIIVLLFSHSLTLATTLLAMAATSGIAALVQAFQLNLQLRGPYKLKETIVEYWSVGGYWSLGTGLLGTLRLQILPWTLAITSGPAASASFQAAINVFNVMNPIVAGLANIIPQTAAQASVKGNAHAWRVTRTYVLLTIAPVVAYSVAVLMAPGPVLQILYGSQSEYLNLSMAVRLLVVAGLTGSVGDVLVHFLHGVAAVPFAFAINAAGMLTTLALAAPMIGALGLDGGCLAVIGGSVSRLIVAHYMLTRNVLAPMTTEMSDPAV